MNGEAKNRLVTAMLAWAVLHLYTSVRTFFENWYNSYTIKSWTLLGIWLLGLLALDVWLYFSGKEKLLRNLKWYWGFSTVLSAVFFLGVLLGYTTPPALITLTLVILMFLAPINQCMAFFWLLFHGMAGLNGTVLHNAIWFAGLLFCLIHFSYIAWIHHRTRKGETA